jgi:hypothetical protein
MKTFRLFHLLIVFVAIFCHTLNAQGLQKQKIAIFNLDARKVQVLDSALIANIVRSEIEKLDTFEVMDKYDISYYIYKNNIDLKNCYGKACLTGVGKQIRSDLILTGSVENYSKYLLVTLRLIDVNNDKIIRVVAREFINNQYELKNMLTISVLEMFNRKADEAIVKKLTIRNDFENELNYPHRNRLKLDGPRMGFALLTDNAANVLTAGKAEGGYEAQYPAVFQFGYQFEKQYLNEGKFQALFEFIPMISGMDHSMFLPSFTILNGIRNNVSGWEFAFGPTIGIGTYAEGYYNSQNKWTLAGDSTNFNLPDTKVIERIDSRGDMKLNSAFVVAFGKSFRSGKMNFPVNVFVVTSKEGWRYGLSFGFNARNSY